MHSDRIDRSYCCVDNPQFLIIVDTLRRDNSFEDHMLDLLGSCSSVCFNFFNVYKPTHAHKGVQPDHRTKFKHFATLSIHCRKPFYLYFLNNMHHIFINKPYFLYVSYAIFLTMQMLSNDMTRGSNQCYWLCHYQFRVHA